MVHSKIKYSNACDTHPFLFMYADDICLFDI